MSGVDWTEFSWEAFATLAAVLAAFWVGTRQTKIQDRQTAIQADALEAERKLRDLEIRCALLDRRATCIERVRQIRAVYAGSAGLTFEQRSHFFEAIRMAELIFPEDAVDGLRELIDNIEKAEMAKRIGETRATRGDEAGRQKAIDDEIPAEDAIWRALPSIDQALVTAARINIT